MHFLEIEKQGKLEIPRMFKKNPTAKKCFYSLDRGPEYCQEGGLA
jgi:hypothetical protein